MADLPLHHLVDALDGGAAARHMPQDVQGVADRGQRIAQLVGQRRQELVLAPVHVRQLLGPLAEFFFDPAAFNGIVQGAPQQLAIDLALDEVILRTGLNGAVSQLLVLGPVNTTTEGRDSGCGRAGRVEPLTLGKRKVQERHVDAAAAEPLQARREPVRALQPEAAAGGIGAAFRGSGARRLRCPR